MTSLGDNTDPTTDNLSPHADFGVAKLSGSNLQGIDFAVTNLSGANPSESNLVSVDNIGLV